MTLKRLPRQPIMYPSSDGTPVAETDVHRELMFDLIFTLQQWLRGQVAYVAGNLFLYYAKGNPKKVISPDVFVAFGVPQRRRKTYKSWQHGGKLPDLVIELTSASTRQIDLGKKRALYGSFGVQEYYLFDPLFDPNLDSEPYPRPVPTAAELTSFTLSEGMLVPSTGPRAFSQVLGLELRVVDGALRFIDPAADALLPTPTELATKLQQEVAARQREAAARQREAAARRAVEEENARLRAEIERLRGGHEGRP